MCVFVCPKTPVQFKTFKNEFVFVQRKDVPKIFRNDPITYNTERSSYFIRRKESTLMGISYHKVVRKPR